MRKIVLAGAATLGLGGCTDGMSHYTPKSSTVKKQIHATIIGGDGVTPFSSTFTKDASTPMQGEGEYTNEVCGATLVSHLPVTIQNVIYDTWGEVEQVRECTVPNEEMHDY